MLALREVQVRLVLKVLSALRARLAIKVIKVPPVHKAPQAFKVRKV